jgi:uncharacterized protein
MQRRSFIQQALLASSACVLPACGKGGARAEVLRALVLQVVLPNTAAVAQNSRRLHTEVERLGAQPSLATLHAAREQWQRALLSWKRAEVFRNGPIMDTNCLLRVMFWPVRSQGINALLQGSQALDDASIGEMGVDRRGLFALEYLLYSAASDEQLVGEFAAPIGQRRAMLARALAGNVSSCAERVGHALGDGNEYANKFADGAQDSLNRLVGQLIYAVENVSASRLARISALAKSGQLKPPAIEGGSGRMSQQIALTYLRASEQLYLGVERGLSQLVKAQSVVIDAALRAAFSQAIAAVSNLALPLEEVAERNPAALDAAAEAVRKLERTLRSELSSTLGVTLTFSSVDGD